MVLGDRLLVVVEHDDEVRLHLARDVQALERLAAGHRAVADEGDDVLCAPGKIARLGETGRKADRGGCMSDVEDVVRALIRIRKAGDRTVLRFVDVGRGASRQHLVRVALVRDIEYNLVARRIKDGVECDRRLDDAQIRPDVPAGDTRTADECIPHLLRECRALCCGIVLDARRAGDGFKIQGRYPPNFTYDKISSIS